MRRIADATRMIDMGKGASTGLRGVLALLVVVFLLTRLPSLPVQAQADPTIIGRAIDAVVQLSIIVRGVVDGDDQLIWYAVGSGTLVSANGLILTNQHLITPEGVDEKLTELEMQ